MKDQKKSFDLRAKHNADLIRRMRNGEALNAIDSKASWYPPRPLIKKDESEMRRLYHERRATKRDDQPAAAAGPVAVVLQQDDATPIDEVS